MTMKDIKVGQYYRHKKFTETLYLGIQSFDKGYIHNHKLRLVIVHCSKAKYIGQGIPHKSDTKEGYYEDFYPIELGEAIKFIKKTKVS